MHADYHDPMGSEPGPRGTAPTPEGRGRPRIVCLSGSTRFRRAFVDWNSYLTAQGYIVLSVGLYGQHQWADPDPGLKARLDELHLRKIDLADEVFVLDVDRYVGDSTRREVEYAFDHGKPIRYLSQVAPGYREPKDELLELLHLAEWLPLFNGPATAALKAEDLSCFECGARWGQNHHRRCRVAGALGVLANVPRPAWWPPDPRCLNAGMNGRLAGLEEAIELTQASPVSHGPDANFAANLVAALRERAAAVRNELSELGVAHGG